MDAENKIQQRIPRSFKETRCHTSHINMNWKIIQLHRKAKSHRVKTFQQSNSIIIKYKEYLEKNFMYIVQNNDYQ